MQAAQIQSERLFLNSVASEYTKSTYKFYLKKYIELCGYKDATELLALGHKQIEDEVINVIITFKERGMKRAAIANYTKPVISFCKINDIMVNTRKINKFLPPRTRNRKSAAYTAEHIQKLLNIADERMRVVILLASGSGLRIGSIPGLSVSSIQDVKDLYMIIVYENEPEEYFVYCTSECRKAIAPPLRGSYKKIIAVDKGTVRQKGPVFNCKSPTH
jgi:site-specific recombinase XerC